MKALLSLVSVFPIFSFIIFLLPGSGYGQSCPGLPAITDSRDGHVYPTVQIGSQCWLQGNMNYKTGNSWCYENNLQNCDIYGLLYDWETAMEVCPLGWHLPSDKEWTILTTYLGGEVAAGAKLKEAGTTHWRSSNTSSADKYGFSALPGGYRLSNDIFSNLCEYAYFWTSTDLSLTHSWIRHLYDSNDEMYRLHSKKDSGFSVRCLKDD